MLSSVQTCWKDRGPNLYQNDQQRNKMWANEFAPLKIQDKEQDSKEQERLEISLIRLDIRQGGALAEHCYAYI